MRRSDERSKSQLQDKWEFDYLFVPAGNSVKCLVCGFELSNSRTFNIKRHYVTKHEYHLAKIKTEDRRDLIEKLKENMRETSTSESSRCEINVQRQSLIASYSVALEIAKHKNAFTDGELIKKCAIKMAKCFGNTDAETNFQSVSLSRRTISRRIADIDKYLTDRLKSLIENGRYYSLCLDESTDIRDVSQLVIFIRIVQNDFTMNEEMLSLASLHGITKGSNIFNAFHEKAKEFNIDFSKCTAIVTDGANTMVGKNTGFCGFLRKHKIMCPTIHCIIHQNALCGKIIKKSESLKIVTKITNYIRGGNKSLMHRKFGAYLKEVDAEFHDLPLHCDVRWLSAGKCLNTFFSIRKEILEFLKSERKTDTFEFEELLSNPKIISQVAFITDLTKHINELNLKLQGKNKTILDLVHCINGFKNKLNLFKIEISKEEFAHFPCCAQVKKEFPNENFAHFTKYIEEITNEFNARFQDISCFQSSISLFINPLLVSIEDQEIEYRLELCDLQADPFLIGRNERAVEFFKLLEEEKYPKLRDFGLKMCSMFGSSYLCESSFSSMKQIKSKERSSLEDSTLTSLMRIATSSIQVNLEELVDKNLAND